MCEHAPQIYPKWVPSRIFIEVLSYCTSRERNIFSFSESNEAFSSPVSQIQTSCAAGRALLFAFCLRFGIVVALLFDNLSTHQKQSQILIWTLWITYGWLFPMVESVSRRRYYNVLRPSTHNDTRIIPKRL